MKHFRRFLDVAVLYLMLAVATSTMLYAVAGLSGCATGKGQLNPATGVYDTALAADKLVVTVERTRDATLDAMDAFMKIEYQNRAALLQINPGIHRFAEYVRVDGKKSLDALTNAKRAFQITRSQADATELTKNLAAVQSLLSTTINFIADIASKKGTP